VNLLKCLYDDIGSSAGPLDALPLRPKKADAHAPFVRVVRQNTIVYILKHGGGGYKRNSLLFSKQEFVERSERKVSG
jgi:hypothetical protein